jgi:hypothetical protein
MAYKDDLQIVESDNCKVVLRCKHVLTGHMRKWERFYRLPVSTPPADAGPVMVWCLLTTNAKGKPHKITWTRNGQYRMAGESRYDIADFQIGQPIQ